MKRLFLIPAIFALGLGSCGSNSNAATSGGGQGNLAYTLDGKKTMAPGTKTIYINEISRKPANGMIKIKVTIFPSGELFDFVVADKGSTNVLHYTPSFDEGNKAGATYLGANAHNYYGDNVTVNITTLDDAHVEGTFSGTFIDEGKSVTETDGSFNLPMTPKKTNSQ